MRDAIEEKQRIEIAYWRDSIDESPNSDSVVTVVNKMTEAAIFLDCMKMYHAEVSPAGRVVELGCGQGWASCIYKKMFPEADVTATDLSGFAVASISKWEAIFGIRVNRSYACKSYETEEDDASVDLIFCFASAHHFLAHRRTVREISRILKPGGKAIYFYEPTSPIYLYSLAHKRVNRKRPEVPEDVLIVSELHKLSKLENLDLRIDYYPSLIHRGPLETIYYYFLSKIPFLQKMVPCTANFIFTKPPSC
ncbi:MAG: class I SAM-dependent methyltransferase [Pseudomonadota bacterium]